jgi:preprotein translocase subunit SecY
MYAECMAALQRPEFRRRLLMTALMVVVYRMGFWLPLPVVDQVALAEKVANGGFGQLLSALALVTASDVGSATVFGLGVMPYISASILFQLLGQVVPSINAMQKEGESGRRKIQEYTRYATVVLCFVQSWMWLRSLGGNMGVLLAGFDSWFWLFACALIMSCGCCVLMWLGEQVDAFGLGGGISTLMVVGILSRAPLAVAFAADPLLRDGVRIGGVAGAESVALLAVGLLCVIAFVVVLTLGLRKIQLEGSGSRAGGRYLPLKVNQAGVMPVIFASSLLMIPTIVVDWFAAGSDWVFLLSVRESLQSQSGVLYWLLFSLLLFFFSFFWTSVGFNPKLVAENLKESGVFVPGYRPGPRTEQYIEEVVIRVTMVGAAGLLVVSLLPGIAASMLGVSGVVASFYGGTGLLIVVSVLLDLKQRAMSYAATQIR